MNQQLTIRLEVSEREKIDTLRFHLETVISCLARGIESGIIHDSSGHSVGEFVRTRKRAHATATTP